MLSDPFEPGSPGTLALSFRTVSGRESIGAACTIEESEDLVSWRSSGVTLDIHPPTSIRLETWTRPRYLRFRLEPSPFDPGAVLIVVGHPRPGSPEE